MIGKFMAVVVKLRFRREVIGQYKRQCKFAICPRSSIASGAGQQCTCLIRAAFKVNGNAHICARPLVDWPFQLLRQAAVVGRWSVDILVR